MNYFKIKDHLETGLHQLSAAYSKAYGKRVQMKAYDAKIR